MKEIFSLVYGTLLTPDLENPLEIQASLRYCEGPSSLFRPSTLLTYKEDEDDGTYALAVAEATAKHASKPRAQWKEELDV